MIGDISGITEDARYIAGGHFVLTGGHAEMILQSLPPIVHIRCESDKAAMRWSIERMREELRYPQAGSSLIAQQLAYTMLIQALRLHLADTASAGPGWLSALSDKHLSIAIASMHNDPGYPWTLRLLAERVGVSRSVTTPISVFGKAFRRVMGCSPRHYTRSTPQSAPRV